MYKVSLTERLCKEILDFYFRGFKVQDNIRPDWCEKLEIDRFYPQFGVAIEIQGPQHYKQVESMQTKDKFAGQLQADTRKRQLINGRGCTYFNLNINHFSEYSHISTVERIKLAGLAYAQSKNDTNIYSRLSIIRISKYPDSQAFKRLAGIKRAGNTPQERMGKRKKFLGVF